LAFNTLALAVLGSSSNRTYNGSSLALLCAYAVHSLAAFFPTPAYTTTPSSRSTRNTPGAFIFADISSSRISKRGASPAARAHCGLTAAAHLRVNARAVFPRACGRAHRDRGRGRGRDFGVDADVETSVRHRVVVIGVRSVARIVSRFLPT